MSQGMRSNSDAASRRAITDRVSLFDWSGIAKNLDRHGYAVVDTPLTKKECATISANFHYDEGFRKHIDMARHNFGRGEYKYFSYPLPGLVADLRTALYPALADIANRWHGAMGIPLRFPDSHSAFLERCHRAGQTRPTPLLLHYGEDDYNCLHQDLYGDHVFPLQAAFLLSTPGEDFTGGEFILTEQRPRMQSRVERVPLGQGDCVIFPVLQRPVRGARGSYRVNLRHGVSRVRSGHRYTLGIIFHDAQ